jgi:hypothetical protein
MQKPTAVLGPPVSSTDISRAATSTPGRWKIFTEAILTQEASVHSPSPYPCRRPVIPYTVTILPEEGEEPAKITFSSFNISTQQPGQQINYIIKLAPCCCISFEMFILNFIYGLSHSSVEFRQL